MESAELQVFLTVAKERSFSRAAARLNRTQPAVSQSVRRLEEELDEKLFDRSSRGGRLTEAGKVLMDYAQRLTQLKEEAETAVRELQDLRRGQVLIGVNEATIHVLLPIVARFHEQHPQARVEVRRVPSRQISTDVLNRTLDFGVLMFQPPEHGLLSLSIGIDELVLLTPPDHPLAGQKQITMEKLGRQSIIAHNDPSPAREQVLRLFEQRHAALNIQIALPSLDAIKRAVEMRLGVALLPLRCALSEIARGQLAAVRVPQLRLQRQIRFISRKVGETSHAAAAFFQTVCEISNQARIKNNRSKNQQKG